MSLSNESKEATLVIHNAKVFTVDEGQPAASAVAVRDNQIVFVGDDEGGRGFVGEQTRVVDGEGRSLLPGFIDSHFHLAWGSQTLIGAQLYGIQSLAGLKTGLDEWMAANPEMPWVLGQGTSYAIPSSEEPLTRHYLDQIESEKPLALTTYDMHSMFVNTAALKAIGLLHGAAEELANGEVVMGEDGMATGELYEMDAMNYVYKAIPDPTMEQQLEIVKKGLALAASYGITSVHNMDGEMEQAQLYAALEEMEALTLRVYVPFWVKPGMSVAYMEEQATQMRESFQSEMLRSNCVKFFMDGVYESYTAVTLTGYPDQPDNLGEPIWDEPTFAQFASAADKLGLQIFVHACGDGAVRRVLDGYASAQQQNGQRDSRHRVEHIEMIGLEDVPRFKQLGVIASMQPLHSPLEENDPDLWPKRVHKADWDRAFAWRTLREADATLAFGSDWPVVTLNPMLGVYAALNRQPWEPGYDPHTQTLAETIRSYTQDAAFAEFQEHKKGQIKVGMWADLVLLSDDIFALPSQALKDTTVEMTVCHGRVVFEK
ncbi:MAG: amidohydrolase [Ardenticatenaceae bacterium]